MTDPAPAPPAPAPGPQGSGWRGVARRGLFESVLIVFSVFLALALDGWREDMSRRRAVQETRASFVAELRQNDRRLRSDNYLGWHRRMDARWRQLKALERPTRADVNAAWGDFNTGVHTLRFRDGVWRSVAAGRLAEDMDRREVILLADVYAQQDDIHELNAAMSAAWRMATPHWNDPEYVHDEVRAMSAYLGDLVQAEQTLARLYAEALRELED